MNKENIILVGGGGHCKASIDVIEQENKYNIVGIVDLPNKIGLKVLGYDIIAKDDDLLALSKNCKYFLVTAGQIENPNLRIKLFNILNKLNVQLPVITSPNSYISKHSTIGKGSIIMHGAIVNAHASIGMNCIINNKALVEHDARIGNHCHISTGAIVNGGVIMGSNTFFGSGAVSKHYTSIPENSFIRANSLTK